jgi:hypothetical protein
LLNLSFSSTYEINLLYKPHALFVNSLPDFVTPFLIAVAAALNLACLPPPYTPLWSSATCAEPLFILLKFLGSEENRCCQVDFEMLVVGIEMLVVGLLVCFCGCV